MEKHKRKNPYKALRHLNRLLGQLRATKEWQLVERVVDTRLEKNV
jgi:hypothetical protein